MGTKRESFKNLDEFGAIIQTLDDYSSIPVSMDLGDRRVSSERVHVMVNTTQNRITMPVGSKYPVFDHKTALGYVEKELVTRNIPVHGFVDVVGDRTYTRILFDGVTAKDADSKVEIGISFENPMDRKTRFRGYGYTFRQICSNGAGITNALPIMEINERHTADMEIRVPPMIHDFVQASLGQSTHMQNLIDVASTTKITFESKEQVLETLKFHFDGVTERHIKRIADQIDSLEPTRWDVFNASNYMTSHYPVSPDVRSVIDKRAELLLDVRFPVNPVKVEVKVEVVEPVVIKRPDFKPDFF